MLKLIGSAIKLCIFAVIVLALGNWIRWGGKTVSDHVKTQFSHAERSRIIEDVKGWTSGVSNKATQEVKKKGPHWLPAGTGANLGADTSKTVASAQGALQTHEQLPDTAAGEKITPTERQKLRALIQELNYNTKN